MSKFIAKLVNKLCVDFAVRVQVLLCLYANHVYHSVKYHHDKKVIGIYKSLFEKTFEKFPKLNDWDWRGIPKIHWLFLIWEYFTTLYFSYILARFLITNYLEDKLVDLLGLNLGRPLYCYMPGRFYVTTLRAVDMTASIVTATLHLIWRLMQYWHKQEMTMHYFLMFTKRDLNKYYEQFIENVCRKEYFLLQNDNQTKGVTPKSATSGFQEKIIECYFHGTLSYKVPITNRIHFYRLRPNRTKQANDRLRNFMSTVSLSAAIIIAIIASIILPLALLQIISARHYNKYYDGCGVESNWLLSARDETATITNIPIIQINWYRLLLFCWDALENFIVWFETGVSVFYGIELATLLNYDLIVYWAKLHDDIVQMHDYLALNHSEMNRRYFSRKERRKSKNKALIEAAPINTIDRIEQDQLDQMIFELQCQMHDFFGELKRSDSNLSDVLTLILFVWGSIFLAYTYISIQGYVWAFEVLVRDVSDVSSRSGTSPYHSFLVLVPMTIITAVYLALLGLHGRCMQTYRYLCPLVAMYQSPKVRKQAFLPILDYFIDRKTCYRLFRMKPFLPATYLSVVGWSFSCFFVVRTMFGRPFS